MIKSDDVSMRDPASVPPLGRIVPRPDPGAGGASMSESDKSSANLPMVLVVILAMLGLTTIPQGGGKPSEAPKASADAGQTGSPRAATDDDKDLGPLATVKADSWPEPTETGMPKPTSGEAMCDSILQGGPELRFLIVLVPDPNGSSMSHEFDLTLTAVQRGTESAGFVAVRWSGMPGFPAAKQEASGDGPKPVSVRVKGTEGGRSVDLSVENSTPARDETRWPAGILCKPTSSAKPGLENTRLLLLLVPESPTWGVDKARLTEAVKLAVKYIELHPGVAGPAAKSLPIRLIGPNFSGSYRSLLETLKPLAEKITVPVGSSKFTVYNGRSLSPDLKVLAGIPRATAQIPVHGSRQQDARRGDHQVCGGSGETGEPGTVRRAGRVQHRVRAGFPKGDPREKIDYYAFPLNISQIREEYAAKGFTRSNEPMNLPSPDRLSPLEMVGAPGEPRPHPGRHAGAVGGGGGADPVADPPGAGEAALRVGRRRGDEPLRPAVPASRSASPVPSAAVLDPLDCALRAPHGRPLPQGDARRLDVPARPRQPGLGRFPGQEPEGSVHPRRVRELLRGGGL